MYNFSEIIMKKRIILFVLGLFFLFPLAGCQTSDITTPQAQYTPTATDSQRTLTICLGYEPESLYVYAAKTQAAWGVLEAIYDGPIDLHIYQAQPVILDSLPSFDNQKVESFEVSVNEGDRVADVHGNPVRLKKGVEIFPYGCRNFNCAIHWDGAEGLQMEQIKATYRLLPGIKWSNGEPHGRRFCFFFPGCQ